MRAVPLRLPLPFLSPSPSPPLLRRALCVAALLLRQLLRLQPLAEGGHPYQEDEDERVVVQL